MEDKSFGQGCPVAIAPAVLSDSQFVHRYFQTQDHHARGLFVCLPL